MSGFEQWIEYAEEDLWLSEAALDGRKYRGALYHAHQTVEKVLKAALIFKGIVPPKTHDLSRLAKRVERIFDIHFDKEAIAFLDSVYISSKYPSDFGLMPHGEPTKEDAERAVAYAKEIFDKILKVMGYDQR